MFLRRYPLIKKNSASYGKIELEDVTVSFDDKNIILKDFSLNIDKGKYVSILGTSGIGKTTLLRAISGFKRISSGLILWKTIRLSVLHKRTLVLPDPGPAVK